MKRLITLCVLALFTVQNTFANNFNSDNDFKDGIIFGKVLDATLNEGLPYVNVIVKKKTGETVTGGISLDDGVFNITKVPEGTYFYVFDVELFEDGISTSKIFKGSVSLLR